MALPPLPEENEKPWYSKRDAFDQAVKSELEGRLSETRLNTTIDERADLKLAPAVTMGRRGTPLRVAPAEAVIANCSVAGHGFTANVPANMTEDTSVPMWGDRSLRLQAATNNNSTTATKTGIGPFDITRKTLRVGALFHDSNLSVLNLRLFSGGGTTNWAQRTLFSSNIEIGALTTIDVSSSELTQTGGTFDPTNVTGIRFTLTTGTAGASVVNVGGALLVTPITTYDNGLVIFGADDTHLSQFQVFAPTLAEYGGQGVLYPVWESMENGDPTKYNPDQARILQDFYGMDFGSHAIDVAHHTDHVGKSEAWLRDHFESIIAKMLSYGFRGRSFAWPNATSDPLARRIAEDYFTSARGSAQQSETLPPNYRMNTRAYNMGIVSVANMKAAIDRAQEGNALAQFFCHRILPTKVDDLDVTVADFKEVVAYAAASGITFATPSLLFN